MQDLLRRFIQEEDGDVVQNVIIVAIFAALALLFGNTIKSFVENLLKNLRSSEEKASSLVSEIQTSSVANSGK